MSNLKPFVLSTAIAIFFNLLTHAQRRYDHIPRVKVERSLPAQMEMPTYSPANKNEENKQPEQMTEDHEVISNKQLSTANKVHPFHQTSTLKKKNIHSNRKKNFKSDKNYHTKKTTRTALSIKDEPLKRMIDSEDLDLMGWICASAAVSFIVAILLNYFLGGFSIFVIIFIIAASVSAVGAAVCFILANVLE